MVSGLGPAVEAAQQVGPCGREVVRPRQVIMYLLREDFSVSYPTIGSKLGGRDHTTVIHSCEKVKREITEDAELAKEIQDIRTLLV